MKSKELIIFLTIIFLLPPALHAHGVKGEFGSGGIVVAAEYDDGEPMSYAWVKISAPGSKLPFQSGRTDKNGRFCFFPDVSGDWKVVVNDAMGHRLEIMVPVGESKKLKIERPAKRSSAGSIPKSEKVLMGISIIFGIFGCLGCLMGWRGYKKA